MKKFLPLIIILAIIAGLAWWFLFGGSEQALIGSLKGDPTLVENYHTARETKKKLMADRENAALYMTLGLDWKTVAEYAPKPAPFFKLSLQVYEDGIEKFGDKNILFYLNAGNIAERLQEYEKARTYYKKAIQISSGDESGYLALADLYEYFLKEPKEKILAIFADGEKMVVYNLPIIGARASYLRRIGDHEAALKDYTVLRENFPDRVGYQEVIAELEQLINEKK